MSFSFKCLVASLLLVGLSASGCKSETKRHPVEGRITFQGTPVLEGSIMFHPMNPEAGFLEGSLIKDGKYLVPAEKGLAEGKYQVLITAPDYKGKRPDPNSAPGAVFEVKELFPQIYNTKSTLSVEVTSKGPNTFDFHLK